MNKLLKLFTTQTSITADIRDITDLDTPLGQQVIQIYEQSFPEVERDPIDVIAQNLRNPNPDEEVNHIRAFIDDGGVVVGFSYFSSYRAYSLGYLQFIAVREGIRGKGYGPILLRDAVRQIEIDGIKATGWPYLGLVLEVERPDMAANDDERQLRERRINFYQRNGATMVEQVDFIAPPLAPGEACLSFHLMLLRCVNKAGMNRWLRQKAIKALLIEGYGENADSWFVNHALEVRQQAKRFTSTSTFKVVQP
jgi:GNAT superfamily N-acetyltransferase